MDTLSFGKYILDTEKCKLYHRDKSIELEPQIYGILELLITRHGEVVSRDDIINAVWDGRRVSDNVIGNRIKSVRAAIGDSGRTQRYIKTYPNLGYKFIGNIRVIDETTQAVEPVGSAQQFEQQRSVQTQPPRKDPFFLQKSKTLKVAAMAVIGVFGFFIISQATRSGITQAPPMNNANDDAVVYKLATSDNPNALPRVAVLPVQAVGDSAEYGFLPDVLKSEINYTITAIDGITVVAISTGADVADDLKDYQTLRDAFDLDYAIISNMISYGEDYKFDVSLIRIEDGTILFNDSFDLDVSSESGLGDLPAIIARKVTLMSANELSLSVDRLPKSWQNYDFYKKYQEAIFVGSRLDYESIKKSLDLLRQVMAEEPNFIPAYTAFLKYLSTQVLFYGEDRNALLKEQAEVGRKMSEVAPEAPETLIKNAFMREYDAGIYDRSLGNYDPRNRVSVAEYILKNDPDNLEAHLILSRFSYGYRSRAKTVEAVESALRFVPTDAKVLSEYYSTLFCNQQIDKARSVLDRASLWHPDHRYVIVAEIEYNRAIGDYETALVNTRKLLKQGIVNTNEVEGPLQLFYDLGYPHLTLPHARDWYDRVKIYASMGDTESAMREASKSDSISRHDRVRQLIDSDSIPVYYRELRTIRRIDSTGEPILRLCSLHKDLRRVYNFKHIDPTNYEKIGSVNYENNLPVLTDYYKDKDVTDLRVQEEFTSLMGLHLLQGHPDKALEVMDAAMERGFIFIGVLKEPYLRDLASYPGFTERLETMQKSADLLIEKYYSD